MSLWIRFFYTAKTKRDSNFLTSASCSSSKITLATEFSDQKLLKCGQDKIIKFQSPSIPEIILGNKIVIFFFHFFLFSLYHVNSHVIMDQYLYLKLTHNDDVISCDQVPTCKYMIMMSCHMTF